MVKEAMRDLVCSMAAAAGVSIGWQAGKKVYAIAEEKVAGAIEDRKARAYNANNGKAE